MADHDFTHTNPDVDVHAMGEVHEHPTWREYKWVALILTLITICEVWIYYTPFRDSPLFAPVLLIMSAVKFAIVVAVLHAPQVRPQIVPRAVHRAVDDRDGYARLAALSVRQVRGAVAPMVIALLHTGASLNRATFSVHPSTVIGIVALAALYERAARLPTMTAPTRSQRLCFHGALVVMFFSLNGWLHDLSDYYLFSAHMVQHSAARVRHRTAARHGHAGRHAASDSPRSRHDAARSLAHATDPLFRDL